MFLLKSYLFLPLEQLCDCLFPSTGINYPCEEHLDELFHVDSHGLDQFLDLPEQFGVNLNFYCFQVLLHYGYAPFWDSRLSNSFWNAAWSLRHSSALAT